MIDGQLAGLTDERVSVCKGVGRRRERPVVSMNVLMVLTAFSGFSNLDLV